MIRRAAAKRSLLVGVFLILWLSSAYVWQARDWNGSSRLMLTYSLIDRGRVAINGLEDHTRDRARVGRNYYSDKMPGFSLLAIPPYLFARHVVGVEKHPIGVAGVGFTHWPADYWIALGTSGLATAAAGALLAWLALRIGCGPTRALLVGLGYGLATPAFVYATLNYGHQATAALLLGAFSLCWAGRSNRAAALAGLLAASAVVVELQVATVAACVGVYLLVLTLRGLRPPGAPAAFLAGCAAPLLVLVGYNTLAFGSPLDMGYFHEDLAQFRNVHSAANPLGLRGPDLTKLGPLLWGEHRGLIFYAPVLVLAVPGWWVLGRRRAWGLLAVSLAACGAVLLVNLSYPEWTGGWSTGPRLLLPLIPFAMIPVAGLLSTGKRSAFVLAWVLVLAGWVEMVLFLGAGGRVPPEFPHPLRQFVLPAWRSGELARNIAALLWGGNEARVGSSALSWFPLIAFQVVAGAGLLWIVKRQARETTTPAN